MSLAPREAGARRRPLTTSRSSEVLPQDARHRSHAKFLSPCGEISIAMRMSWRVRRSAQSTHLSMQPL
eukprot:5314334-Pyramimonas_sp.AAC.1